VAGWERWCAAAGRVVCRCWWRWPGWHLNCHCGRPHNDTACPTGVAV